MRWRDWLNETRIEVDAATKRRHLDTLDRVLDEQRSRRTRPGRVLAVAVALVLLLPVVAFAAERSGPGDFLYPVRQAMERANIRITGPDSFGLDPFEFGGEPGPSGTFSATDQRPTTTSTTQQQRDEDHPHRPTTTTTTPGRTESTRPGTSTTLSSTTTTIPERTPTTRPDR